MKCLNCNREFIANAHNQKYCCENCGKEYRQNNSAVYESIEFNCSWCGDLVVTDPDRYDKRTRFCSQSCERKYWRKPHHEHKSNFINVKLTEDGNYRY